VSLLPSTTEILFALGGSEDLYHLDEGALAGLDADLVVTQDLCAVCAVDVSEVNEALDYLACRAEVLTVDPYTLDEVLESIRVLGDATDTRARADELVATLSARLDTLAHRLAGRETVPTLVLEWTDPPFAPGHWVPDMVTRAGGTCVMGTGGERSFRTSWDEVAKTAPQIVVCAPCGFDLAGSSRLAEPVAANLPAGVPVWAVDANASFARPGPRLVDGVEALAAILHPDLCDVPDPGLARRIV
jgi:iron complex transport system substrate-binding protein